ncbi:MAG: ankyrin repeat domain-containing protein [Verrucomicrobiaceae bacterium]|nr:ankyrin repeat domain-containing protein [Verrucomicrobiaceae bacterium]
MANSTRAPFYELRDLLLSAPQEGLARLKQDRSLLDARSGLGETLLHWMAVEDAASLVSALIELGAEIDTVNHFGSTPLQEAVQLGRTEISLALLARGASVTHINDAGDSVISTSTILKRHTQLIAALLERLPYDIPLSEVIDEMTLESIRHRDDPVAALFRARGIPESTYWNS